MRIATKFYIFTSKELKQIALNDMNARKKIRKVWQEFLKKYGAETEGFYVVHSFNEERLVGVTFKKEPDSSLWREPKNGSDGYEPNKGTKRGRALVKEMYELPRWSPKGVAAAVKWRDLFCNCSFFTLGFFYGKKHFGGISVPVFTARDYKNDPKLRYKPVKGMREITSDTYHKRMK